MSQGYSSFNFSIDLFFTKIHFFSIILPNKIKPPHKLFLGVWEAGLVSAKSELILFYFYIVNLLHYLISLR